jgi:CO/xanthine dehydrogenase Mo-binding subunit
VERGVVRAPGSSLSVSYAELFSGRRFERDVTGEATPKSPDTYRIVGKPGPRIDLEPKLRGGAFVQDLRLPDTCFGRVARPPGPGAELLSVDLDAVRALPGVIAAVRDGAFLGVVAEREEQAERACTALAESARWREHATLPGDVDLEAWLRDQPRDSHAVVDGVALEDPPEPWEPPEDAARTVSRSYFRPYLMHASIGPSAAVAQLRDDELTLWTHAQGVMFTREALIPVLGLPRESIRLIHVDGPGCYGHNGADDVACDAALLARAVPGRPVFVQWTREDEHGWEPYGPATAVDLAATLDATGRVSSWSHEVASQTHVGRPRPGEEGSRFLSANLLEEPLPCPAPQARLGPEVGIHRNAWPGYAFAQRRVVKHMVRTPGPRTSSLRSLGAFANVFAIESFIDELALAADADPLEFRLRHLEDPRAREVLEAAASAIGWPDAPAPGRGLGLAYARYANAKAYCAVGIDAEVDARGAIRLHRAVVAADAGQVVDPSGLANQLEGGVVQSASWTLREEVRLDATRVRSRDWDTYPILRFSEVPPIETVLLDRPGERFLGAGEASTGPTPAAIANAVFRASGRRLRRTPFTPERVRATDPLR